MFHARSESMIRLILCTSIACLAASCVPPKAILVEEAPAAVPKTNKPANLQPEELLPVPQVAQGNKMRVQDPSRQLPDSKDFTPTAPAVNNAGAVIASPPGGNKPAPAPETKPSE